jgi:hypothetical protein
MTAMTRSARRKGAYDHGSNRPVREYEESAPMSDEVGRIADALLRPVYDAVAHDDAKQAKARERVTLRKFSWE